MAVVTALGAHAPRTHVGALPHGPAQLLTRTLRASAQVAEAGALSLSVWRPFAHDASVRLLLEMGASLPGLDLEVLGEPSAQVLGGVRPRSSTGRR